MHVCMHVCMYVPASAAAAAAPHALRWRRDRPSQPLSATALLFLRRATDALPNANVWLCHWQAQQQALPQAQQQHVQQQLQQMQQQTQPTQQLLQQMQQMQQQIQQLKMQQQMQQMQATHVQQPQPQQQQHYQQQQIPVGIMSPHPAHGGGMIGTVQIRIRGACSVCKTNVYDTQAREKDPVTGAYRHSNPQDCKVIAAGGSTQGVGGSGGLYETPSAHEGISAAPQQPTTQQMLTRISDISAEPLCMLNPIVGIKDTARHPIMHAAIATGVDDMDAFGWVAGEHGSALAKNDPHGLDRDEVAAIALYTTESKLYPKLNGYLRDRDRRNLLPYFPYLRLLLDARRKMPRYVGTVWRGVQGVDLTAKFPRGMDIYWWAFSSTTKNLSTLENQQFLGTSGVRTIFNIQVKRGIDISRYSMFQGQQSEAEVLLFPGTALRVVDSMAMGAGLFMVHLEEIELSIDLFR